MKLRARILASSVVLGLLAASCGAGTGVAPVETPTPGGQQAAATPVPSPVAKPANLVLIVDTVRGQQGLTDEEKKLDGAGIHCVVMSRFPQDSRIVWRVKVLDPTSMKSLDDKDLISVVLTLPDSKTTDLKYGGHGGTKENPADRFWAAGFTVPKDYPTGVFNYRIDAKSKEGATGTYGYDAFKVTAAQLMIVPYPYPKR